MEAFRKVIKGWLGKVLLVLFLIPLALVGIEGYFSGGSKDVVKSVDGEDITQKQLDGAVNALKQQYLPMVNNDETLLNLDNIQEKALESLMARTLLLQQAKTLGIALSDQQIEQMIAQQPSFQENGKFSEALYARYLQSIGMTSQALIAGLRDDHALKILSSAILDNALVSPSDAEQIIQLQTEQRTLHLASIKLDEYKKNVQVTDAEIAEYFKKSPLQFKQMANVDVDFVEISPELVTGNIAEPTEQELKQAYEAYVASEKTKVEEKVQHILIATGERSDADAKKRADEVVAKIKAGLSFADAAQQYSDDTESKASAGLIAAYEKGVFDAAFDQAVEGLTEGEVSAPVKTAYGYHVILTQIPEVEVAPFATQKERLMTDLKAQKKANAYADLVNSLNDMVVGSDALDVVTQEVKAAKVVSAQKVTLGTRHPVLSDANVKIKLFNEDVKNGDRNASSSIQLANGNTVWVKVNQYHAAGIPQLDQVKAQVKSKLIEKKAFDAAKAKIQSTLNAFKKEAGASVAAKSGLKFENAGPVMRQGVLKEIERAAFSVAAPKNDQWSVTTAALPNELIVVAVSAVSQGITLNEEQKAQSIQLYQQNRAEQELQDYTHYLKSQAKISENSKAK